MAVGNGKVEVPRMDEGERKEVCARLEWEGGLEYLVITGYDFPEIKDEHFHALREAFVNAARALEGYVRYDDYLNEIPEGEDRDERPSH